MVSSPPAPPARSGSLPTTPIARRRFRPPPLPAPPATAEGRASRPRPGGAPPKTTSVRTATRPAAGGETLLIRSSRRSTDATEEPSQRVVSLAGNRRCKRVTPLLFTPLICPSSRGRIRLQTSQPSRRRRTRGNADLRSFLSGPFSILKSVVATKKKCVL